MATSARRSHSGITPSNPAHGAGKEQAAGALQRLRAARDSKKTNSSILEARPKPSADIDRVRLVHLPVPCMQRCTPKHIHYKEEFETM